jgi:hypothetical protein
MKQVQTVADEYISSGCGHSTICIGCYRQVATAQQLQQLHAGACHPAKELSV